MKIDYFKYTFNVAWGCCKVSPGCDNCYAEEDAAAKYPIKMWGKNAQRRIFGAKYWERPLQWNKEEKGAKRRPIVFCSSMADVFERHTTIDQERKKLWPLIEATPNLDWLIITKRAENIERNMPFDKHADPWPNLWVAVSVEDDVRARVRLPYIAKLNVAVRGAHVEPLLGPIPTLAHYINDLDWVLVGGESCDENPQKARPMQPSWVREVTNICQGANVPFHFKQWGSQKPVAKNLDGTIQFKAMKRWQAGRTFLGKIWDRYPVPKIGAAR